MRPHTLNIFPSEPMHVEPPPKPPKGGSGSKKSSEPSMELSNPRNDVASAPQPAKVVKREGNHKGPTSSSEQDGPKTPDPKAYVQQLESSRMKLTQLEQELQRARSQGFFLGGDQGHPGAMGNMASDTALFDMEYARWLEEQHRLTVELRNAVHEHLPENELRILLDNCLAHYDQIINLKNLFVKSDVFHIFSGMWRTPAERCFMWMGGFRPSELIKVILSAIEPLTEQQMVGIYGLQQSTHEAEEALSHGLEALNQSLSETITSDCLTVPPNMNTYMAQMSIAINKLSTLEGFVRQADNLRHQTLHRLHQLLTTRQAARCFLAIAEYFHRLRALSSLWLGRPRHE
ncbi:bZIP transcription factor family protein [Perilla frutescens var. frutescens]|nr:bZIP transcription factor family protein [Perilla frutescens var. frutescens]